MSTNLPTIALILSILSLLGLGYGLWQISSLNRLRKHFFAGTKALDLESVIRGLAQDLQTSQERERVLEQSLNELRNDFGYAIQNLGLVRFNPFEDGGGNFSFCLAVLDAHNNGIVLTSMHGRQQNRIYTKRIIGGKSEAQLTEEEQQAILLANQKNKI